MTEELNDMRRDAAAYENATRRSEDKCKIAREAAKKAHESTKDLPRNLIVAGILASAST